MIEDLTKSQLILLTVLVNFVTSVATGILTVSLLDEAPPVVTQTINRVVEHTVETVTQVAPAAVIQAPKPSVEDLITTAFAASDARHVVFYDPQVGTSTPAALGTYLPRSRAAVTLSTVGLPKEVLIRFADGSIAPASLTQHDDEIAIYGFGDSEKLPQAPSATLIAAKDLKIGQTALSVVADGSAATGIVTKMGDTGVYTSLPQVKGGVSVVDLSGNIIGVSGGGEAGLFVSADRIRDLFAATTTPATAAPSS
jgi:hypothetical protein